MTNSEYIARYLQARGITHVYELIGGMITFLLDSLHQHTDIKIVSMHHEQGAGFAAEGWARMRGLPGVALATSGPGATNLITAVGSCYFDSVPAVFITGQVNRHEQKGEREVRQLGFQETDIVAMVRPVTKAAWIVNNPEDLPRILDEAFHLAASGRPGPVLVDVPMDVQRHSLPDHTVIPRGHFPHEPLVIGPTEEVDAFLERLAVALSAAQRPVILAGGGLRSSLAVGPFRALVEHLQIPVIHSLMGVDVLPFGHPQRFGMLGSYGNRWANLGFALSDLVVVLGSRLDIRQTGSDVAGFRAGRAFFHVDCMPAEINNRVTGCEALHEELKPFLQRALARLPAGAGRRPAWEQELDALRAAWPDTEELKGLKGINPNAFLHQLARATQFASAYVSDVGQHQMWAAQSLEIGPHQRFLTSGGMGAMGFALPAAIGAAFASGSTVMIAGDGGFQLNIQELQAIRRNNLPIKLIVLNNGCHGMVRQFQESYFDARYQSTMWGYDTPSFVAIAEAYGIRAETIAEEEQVPAALANLTLNPAEPCLLEVFIDTYANAYPKLAFGQNFGEMEPLAKPIDMEGT